MQIGRAGVPHRDSIGAGVSEVEISGGGRGAEEEGEGSRSVERRSVKIRIKIGN